MIVTAAELRRAGLDSRAVRRAVAAGAITRVGRGVYLDAEPAPHQAELAAAIGCRGVLGGPSAAVLHGLPLLREPAQPWVVVPADRHRPAPPGVVLRRSDPLQPPAGLPVAGGLDTVVQCARWLPHGEAVVVADAALHRGLVHPGALRDAARATRGPGSGRVRRVALDADGRSESPLETLTRLLLVAAGLAPEELQHVVLDRFGGYVLRADFAWPSARLVLETDGVAIHGTHEQAAHDRRTGNALQLAGWRVLRFTWADVVHQPDTVVAAVRALLG